MLVVVRRRFRSCFLTLWHLALVAGLVWMVAARPVESQAAPGNPREHGQLTSILHPEPHLYKPVDFAGSVRSPYPMSGRARVLDQAFARLAGVQTRPLLSILTMPVDAALPDLQLITPPADGRTHLLLQPSRQSYTGPLPSQPAQTAPSMANGATLVDGWTTLFATGFEEEMPFTSCTTQAAPGRRWEAVSGNTVAGFFSAWPAATNALPTGAEAANASTWLVCGPFSVAPLDRFLIQYSYRLATAPADRMFFGVSSDGQTFHGGLTGGLVGNWLTSSVLVEGQRGAQLWVGWAYSGDPASAADTGVWIDNLNVARYTPPDTSCDPLAQGDKGIVLNPYDPTTASRAPIIRPGDTVVVDQLLAADVHWVRLGFFATEDGINLPEYDRIIDTLCAHGISVLGLLNHETLLRQDYPSEDEATVAAYRTEFAGLAEFLAAYYADRVTIWEVWNEPNLVEGAYLSPARYARLLQRTYQGIKRANPGAQVLLGGLASAWGDSNEYLLALYGEFDQNLQGARPFDHLALHPYPRKGEGPDPDVYMFADQQFGYHTIIDKFLQTMAAHGDGAKSVWITEVGWNSALASPNRPVCFAPILVQEDDQARYLKRVFDILFNEVSYWGRPQEQAVAKVFWYQYMDVGTLDPCGSAQSGAGLLPKDWWFGLYRGDRVTPKPGWCAFAAYPQPCSATESAQ